MKTAKHNQDGFVSIVVCLLIMIILTLITIGFAQVMGREQRQAVDRQLSMQAFYAAESGVNDAATKLRQNSSYEKLNDCNEISLNPGLGGGGNIPKDIDSTSPGTVRSTCVTVDPTPEVLIYSPVSTDLNVPTVTMLKASAVITEFNVSWAPVGNDTITNRFTTTSSFVPYNAWDAQTGMLKLTLVRFTPGDTRDTIAENTKVVYLRPVAGATVPTFNLSSLNAATNGTVINGACSTNPTDGDSSCDVKFIGVNDPSASGGSLYLAMSSLYKPNNVLIQANNGTVSFLNSQAVIDSTGRVGDVLRRINVRRSLSGTYQIPGGGVVTDGAICKLITAAPSPASTSDTTCGL